MHTTFQSVNINGGSDKRTCQDNIKMGLRGGYESVDCIDLIQYRRPVPQSCERGRLMKRIRYPAD